jgi:hypothetical protein
LCRFTIGAHDGWTGGRGGGQSSGPLRCLDIVFQSMCDAIIFGLVGRWNAQPGQSPSR